MAQASPNYSLTSQ
jgi:DNA polymerase III psi subunit